MIAGVLRDDERTIKNERVTTSYVYGIKEQAYSRWYSYERYERTDTCLSDFSFIDVSSSNKNLEKVLSR